MHKAKPISPPFAGHFKLSMKQSPISEKEKAEMKNFPYSSAIRSLIFNKSRKRTLDSCEMNIAIS